MDRMSSTASFDGRVAVVTGGGSGLGRAIAEELARLGARVVVASRKKARLDAVVDAITARGGVAASVVTDVGKPEDAAHLVAVTQATFGSVDILINSAAINFIRPAKDLRPAVWHRVVNVVLNGSFYCAHAAGRAMIASGRGGAIVSIVATYAWGAGPGVVHSAAAKAGVLALTRTLAVEWARYGIRVNAIAPGVTDTVGAANSLWPSAAEYERLVATVPMGRAGQPREIAAATAFLCSEQASYVTGACLTVDGGEWLRRGYQPPGV
jgi:NAD(P)-dependent dehydrogenase (short-subunit alcohol dehydrogenase family)